MEERITKMSIMKSGGNSNNKGRAYRVIIPPKWAKMLGVNDEKRLLKITFDDESGRIIIEKIKE